MLTQIYFFSFGTILGSFICLCADRTVCHQSIIRPRSHCSTCHHVLSVTELFPIVSYCFLNGRCRHCHQRFEPTSCLTELLLGVLFLTVSGNQAPSWSLLTDLFCMTLLVYLSLCDLNRLWVNGYLIAILALVAVMTNNTLMNWGIFVGTLISLFTPLQFSQFYAGFGEADYDLLLIFIILCGLEATTLIVCLASLICLLFTLIFHIPPKQKIPFIPYLTFAYLYVVI
ncbi:prepilin peptidase [Pediococcus siamensis]|uniref:prepilin peptidase n=1 Tax=Pediococcus siamensis TaxID=381829 RepID=UPI0039A27190